MRCEHEFAPATSPDRNRHPHSIGTTVELIFGFRHERRTERGQARAESTKSIHSTTLWQELFPAQQARVTSCCGVETSSRGIRPRLDDIQCGCPDQLGLLYPIASPDGFKAPCCRSSLHPSARALDLFQHPHRLRFLLLLEASGGLEVLGDPPAPLQVRVHGALPQRKGGELLRVV
jgi:hypothetical protein